VTYFQGIVNGIIGTLVCLGCFAGLWWLYSAPTINPQTSKPEAPAKVEQILKEDQITGMKLTPEAERRLGIETARIESQSIRRVRSYGGEVMVPVGHTILVSAPVSGVLKAPPTGPPPVGKSVKKGQTIFLLAPLLTPEARTTLATARVDADGKYEAARHDVEVKKLALDRAKRLVEQQAAAKRTLEEAQASYDIATRSLEAFRGQREVLMKIASEVERGTAEPLPIVAPEDGILRTLTATPGQNVHAGAALFEVVDLSVVWIRVPVYAGDLPDIAADQPARVGDTTLRSDVPMQLAQPVPAPPSANALAGTADLYYELPNINSPLAPGQRVALTLSLRGDEKGPTVPASAIVYDIHGGTWVYEKTGPSAYARRRVQVRYVLGDRAVLAATTSPGMLVATTGAAELFGTEVGFSK